MLDNLLTDTIKTVAAVCLVLGVVAGFILQPMFDSRPRLRQAQAAPEPVASGATIGEMLQFKQQQKGGKKR